jgi:hypothetical protein
MATAHKAVTDFTFATVAALTLTGSPQVVERKVPTDRNLTAPFILVALGERERLDWPQAGEPGSSETLYTGYPVVVVFGQKSNQALAVDDVELSWRDVVLTTFRDRDTFLVVPGLPTGQTFLHCQVEPMPIIDLTLFREANIVAGALTLWYWIERPRPTS